MALTILEGSTFCICDERGDIDAEGSGLFADDTRFLSRLTLTINGERPLLLSSDKVEYFSAAFYLRNPLAGELGQDAVGIARERFVGDGMQDRIVVRNVGMEPVEFELALELEADFADIFLVKARDFALGDPRHAGALPPAAPPRFDEERVCLSFVDPDQDSTASTYVYFSVLGELDGTTMLYRVELEPRETWEVELDLHASLAGDGIEHRRRRLHFGAEVEHVRESLDAWHLRVPQLRASWGPLRGCFERSVSDLAALRLRGAGGIGQLPAAGMPWFMTVFGRDTIITSLQTLLFGPELASAALTVLAELQADEDDAGIDAEPGKIVHEVRNGKAARTWFPRYYGTVDATPLYLILLSEVWRWTDDQLLVRELKQPALRALEWIDRHGDRDGDGFVEFERRTDRGLENQSWKDSGDSQRFADGTLARTPIAPCEVQGYVYDAKRRAAELARVVWRDRELSERLEREADELRERFDAAFWVDRRGGYYALALDGDKRPVDALTSNVGHLLWSGIVPTRRLDAVVDRLMGERLWSGWGVRTMSTEDRAYNPLSYHNGTVWPHDNSLIAWGLARYGRWPEAHRIVRRMLEAASYFGHELPEVFAGLPRAQTPFPIAYPTAARPQAWAAGTPILLLQLLLGLRPDPRRQVLRTNAPPELPGWAGEIAVSGVRAFDRSWDVVVEGGAVTVEQS
jgi:glycogen debranching enzyme